MQEKDFFGKWVERGHINNQIEISSRRILLQRIIMLSAIDLLRTKNIPEIRQLISKLDGDSTRKKSELQQMVGSKYHDFIQSADSIRTMSKKADEMQQNLGTFLNSSQLISFFSYYGQ